MLTLTLTPPPLLTFVNIFETPPSLLSVNVIYTWGNRENIIGKVRATHLVNRIRLARNFGHSFKEVVKLFQIALQTFLMKSISGKV